MKTYLFTTLALVILPFFVVSVAVTHAQATCGEIIIPANNYNGTPEKRTTITDCANPFQTTTDVANPYTVQVNGETVSPGGTAIVQDGRTTSVEVSGNPYLTNYSVEYYKHDSNDYRQARINYYADVPKDELLKYADTYFTNTTVRDLYKEITSASDPDSYFYDGNGGLYLRQRRICD